MLWLHEWPKQTQCVVAARSCEAWQDPRRFLRSHVYRTPLHGRRNMAVTTTEGYCPRISLVSITEAATRRVATDRMLLVDHLDSELSRAGASDEESIDHILTTCGHPTRPQYGRRRESCGSVERTLETRRVGKHQVGQARIENRVWAASEAPGQRIPRIDHRLQLTPRW